MIAKLINAAFIFIKRDTFHKQQCGSLDIMQKLKNKNNLLTQKCQLQTSKKEIYVSSHLAFIIVFTIELNQVSFWNCISEYFREKVRDRTTLLN
jgi:hypothetical protein